MSSSLRLPSYRVFPVESPHDINGEFQRFFCPSQVDLLGHFQFTLYTADREALGQYVVRGAIGTKKIHYDEASDTVVWTASPKGFYKGTSETFKGFEFVDQKVVAKGLRS